MRLNLANDVRSEQYEKCSLVEISEEQKKACFLCSTLVSENHPRINASN